MTNAIQISCLSKHFGDVRAVDEIDLEIEAGEFFFLLGPSGCGKTTLLRILAGLQTPDSGEVFLHGKNVCTLPPHKRGVPMVFQNYALFPHLTVIENVMFGLIEHKCSKKESKLKAEKALDCVNLSGYGDRKPSQLSGGQQQRVALARALAVEPTILLLDEPLSNLDAKLRHEMRDELQRLHKELKLTFVYVTHDQSEALALADRMAVMNHGKIAAVGKPNELYHRPPNLFTASFLGEANPMQGVVEQSGTHIQTPLGKWRLSSPVEAGDATCVFRPESILAGDGVNSFVAKVSQIHNHGATLTLFLEAESMLLDANAMQLRATVVNVPGYEWKLGASSRWHISPDAMVAVRD